MKFIGFLLWNSQKRLTLEATRNTLHAPWIFKMVMSETRNIHKMLWRTYCCANFFGTILGEDNFNFAETSLTFFGCPAKIFHPAVSGHLRMLAPSMFKYHIRHWLSLLSARVLNLIRSIYKSWQLITMCSHAIY